MGISLLPKSVMFWANICRMVTDQNWTNAHGVHWREGRDRLHRERKCLWGSSQLADTLYVLMEDKKILPFESDLSDFLSNTDIRKNGEKEIIRIKILS